MSLVPLAVQLMPDFANDLEPAIARYASTAHRHCSQPTHTVAVGMHPNAKDERMNLRNACRAPTPIGVAWSIHWYGRQLHVVLESLQPSAALSVATKMAGTSRVPKGRQPPTRTDVLCRCRMGTALLGSQTKSIIVPHARKVRAAREPADAANRPCMADSLADGVEPREKKWESSPPTRDVPPE